MPRLKELCCCEMLRSLLQGVDGLYTVSAEALRQTLAWRLEACELVEGSSFRANEHLDRLILLLIAALRDLAEILVSVVLS